MAKHLLLFIFSISIAYSALSQEGAVIKEDSLETSVVKADTLDTPSTSGIAEETQDSVIVKRFFTPAIYIDYGKLLTIPIELETKYEVGVELLFWEKIPLIVEVGSSTVNPDQAFGNGTYEATGTYYRIGTGFYSQFNPKNKLGLTLRYGASSFDETSRISIESPSGIQDTYIESIDRENVSASWFEAVIYSDRKLNDLFSLGLNIRFRVLQSYDQFSPVDVYAIPGYGRSFENTAPSANLFFKVSF